MSVLVELSPRAAVLASFGIVAGLLAVILILAPANRVANRHLGMAILVLVGLVASYTIGLSRLDRAISGLRYLPTSVPLAFGPLLYAYIRHLTTGKGLSWPLLHFVPAVLHSAYLVIFYLLPGNTQAVIDDGRGKDVLRAGFDTLVLFSFGAYSVAGLRSLATYRAWIADNRSNAELWALGWVRNLLLSTIITLVGFAAVRAQTWVHGRPDVFDLYGFNIWIVGVAVFLGVEGRRFADRPFPRISNLSSISSYNSSVEGSALVSQEATSAPSPAKDWAVVGATWRDRTDIEGWWREPSLSLPELARRLGTNTSQLSRAINQGLGMSFPDMINGMRANEVARSMGQDGNRSRDLLDIAFEAGFNSKASFNRSFKAMHGSSPTAFRERARVRS